MPVMKNKNNNKKNDYISHPYDQQDGVLVLNKPKGISSGQAIARIKHGFTQKKIGHGGTLDPMAEGVLLVLLGQATKLSGHLLDVGTKIYSGTILLGVETDTWDMEGEIIAEKDPSKVSSEAVQEAMKELVGTYEQVVPAFSAAKHRGTPLYKLAREGKETPVKKKLVTVYSGEAELVSPTQVKFRVECNSGTYIRSLAHSLGKRLECGAALEKLIRDHSHPFSLDEAVSFDELAAEPESFPKHIHSFSEALPEWPRIIIRKELAEDVKNGMPLAYAVWEEASIFRKGLMALFENTDGSPLALVEADLVDGRESWRVSRGLWN